MTAFAAVIVALRVFDAAVKRAVRCFDHPEYAERLRRAFARAL